MAAARLFRGCNDPPFLITIISILVPRRSASNPRSCWYSGEKRVDPSPSSDMVNQNQGGFMREKFVVAAITGYVFLSAFSLSPAAYAQHFNFTLTQDGLRGKQAECGVIGSVGANGYVVQNWHIGRYIIVADNLVLTARSEIDNSHAYCGLGGINGVPGMIYLDTSNQGVGV